MTLGFTNITAISDEIGSASAIKMIRSVMVKGIEAMSAECTVAQVLPCYRVLDQFDRQLRHG